MSARRNTPRGGADGAPASGRLVALDEAAEALSVSVKTLRRRIADGTVRGYRVGRLVRVDVDEVREALVVVIPTVR
ncbi:excisionase family DNA-binding protein [Antribacter gilvus]|uniref:excisionase family DNA-binding protein n=1 Tax=Antribacter gilvus TaxID=2304675 RepID=UPI000F79A6BB|nr:excisionase family DNA-binding protein [Antribacter gilvus]